MELETWTAPWDETGEIPNHPRFAVLVYRGVEALGGDAGADPDAAARALFARHGWGGAWTNGVFDFHHFHSNAHEALAVVAGSATLELGGPRVGTSFTVGAGDVVVLPAGTGHCRVAATGDFTVVGAYPRGQEDYDLLRAADDAARERIRRLAAPDDDPVGGEGVAQWR